MRVFKFNILLVLMLLSIQPELLAQNIPHTRYIDSLQTLLKKASKDSNQVILLEKISLAYSQSDPTKGLDYAAKANKLAVELKLRNREAASLAMMAVNYLAASQPERGIEYNKKAIEIYKATNNKKALAAVNSNLAKIYLQRGDYAKALECSFTALDIYEHSKEYRNKGIVLEFIANIHYELKNLKKAETYYKQVLELYKNYGTKADLARCMGNMSRVEMDNEHYAKALEYLNKALKINKALDNKNSVIINLTNIANVYSKQKQHEKAIAVMTESLQMSEKLGMKNSIAVNKGNLGGIYLERYKASGHEDVALLEKAIDNTKEAIAICESIGFLAPKIEFSKTLTEAYSLKKDYKKAYETLKKKNILSDSLKATEAEAALASLEAKREKDLKEKDIVIKSKELEIIRLQSQKKTMLYSLIISVLVITFALIIRHFVRKQREHNKILSEIKQIQSHEIRGPIASILGLAALLKNSSPEEVTRHQIVEGIEELALKLDEIVTKITKNSSH